MWCNGVYLRVPARSPALPWRRPCAAASCKGQAADRCVQAAGGRACGSTSCWAGCRGDPCCPCLPRPTAACPAPLPRRLRAAASSKRARSRRRAAAPCCTSNSRAHTFQAPVPCLRASPARPRHAGAAPSRNLILSPAAAGRAVAPWPPRADDLMGCRPRSSFRDSFVPPPSTPTRRATPPAPHACATQPPPLPCSSVCHQATPRSKPPSTVPRCSCSPCPGVAAESRCSSS